MRILGTKFGSAAPSSCRPETWDRGPVIETTAVEIRRHCSNLLHVDPSLLVCQILKETFFSNVSTSDAVAHQNLPS